MDINRDGFTILMADDDDDEFFLFKGGLEETHFDFDQRRMQDGRELMDYLLKEGKFTDPEHGPQPFKKNIS